MRFDSYHPAINFIYFAAVIGCTVAFRHPAFLLISYASAFLYAVKLSGRRALRFGLSLLPLMALYVLWYAANNHFGVTALFRNSAGNMITLQAIVQGTVIAVTVSSVLLWFSCVNAIITADKTVYLFGRISPHLSLFLAILLRMVPRIRKEAQRITTAQCCIGRGPGQGNPLERVRNFLRIVSMTITWAIDSLVTASDSMNARGYTLKGRTAYSLYRFGHRDGALVLVLLALFAAALAAAKLGQTNMLCNPVFSLPDVTALSVFFYTAYAGFCLLPAVLQVFGERRFARLQQAI